MPLQRSITTLDDVRAALKDGEIHLVYLPIVTLRNERCIGAEALIYWRRGHVVLRPIEFLHLVQRTPVCGELAHWLIDTIATELGVWLAENPHLQISINVPPDILSRGAPEYAASCSGRCGRVDQIVLEITEHSVPDRRGIDALNALAERGVRIALDDVALNGVDLAVLARCNFGVIKLDRCVAYQLTPTSAEPSWVAPLGSLLRNSPLQVIADGVESLHQVSALRAAGVQMGQGYMFSAPLPIDDLKSYCRNINGLEMNAPLPSVCTSRN